MGLTNIFMGDHIKALSRYFYILVWGVFETGLSIHFIGALQFLYSQSPPFLRCSIVGLFLFAQGVGYILAAGMLGMIQACFNFKDVLGDDFLGYFNILLCLSCATATVLFYFIKSWYEKHSEEREGQGAEPILTADAQSACTHSTI